MNVFEIIYEYRVAFWGGLKVTLELCFISWFVGIALGLLLGVVSFKSNNFLTKSVSFISFFIFSIPFLILLYWIHYPFQSLISINIDPFYTSLFILILINSFGVSTITMNALRELPEEYIIAGKVCGLSNNQIVRKIQIPLISRQIIPNLLNLEVNILHLTLFTSLISVEELFRVCQQINSTIYKPVEIYTALAIFFILICVPLSGTAYYLKNNLVKKSINY